MSGWSEVLVWQPRHHGPTRVVQMRVGKGKWGKEVNLLIAAGLTDQVTVSRCDGLIRVCARNSGMGYAGLEVFDPTMVSTEMFPMYDGYGNLGGKIEVLRPVWEAFDQEKGDDRALFELYSYYKREG